MMMAGAHEHRVSSQDFYNQELEMKVPTIRELLQQDRPLLGAWHYIPHYDYTGLIAEAGYDFILIDNEHGGRSIESIQHSVMAANARGVPAIVRCHDKQQWAIEEVLDIGAQGVLMPILETVEDAKLLARSARFAPTGERGFCPMQRSGRYGANFDIVTNSDRDIFVAGILETPLAYENLDEILKVPGIDAFQPGPGDLSIRMGFPVFPTNPKVLKLLETAYDKIIAAGKIAWNPGTPEMGLVDLKKTGVRMFAAGSDTDLLHFLREKRLAAAKQIEEARKSLKK
jgi:2-keto-3-deoxy-L-rhamnonate aldolase RhmA